MKFPHAGWCAGSARRRNRFRVRDARCAEEWMSVDPYWACPDPYRCASEAVSPRPQPTFPIALSSFQIRTVHQGAWRGTTNGPSNRPLPLGTFDVERQASSVSCARVGWGGGWARAALLARSKSFWGSLVLQPPRARRTASSGIPPGGAEDHDSSEMTGVAGNTYVDIRAG